MVSNNKAKCPKCYGEMKYYDNVKRIVRTKRRVTKRVKILRLRCINCGAIHRVIPRLLYPYKQYEAELIRGVIEGLITPETLGYEDYPCEATMERWKSQNSHFLL